MVPMTKSKNSFRPWRTNTVEIGKGVHQGCYILPIVFNFYIEQLAKEALGMGDFKIGDRVIETMKYANVLVLLMKEEETLQDIYTWHKLVVM